MVQSGEKISTGSEDRRERVPVLAPAGFCESRLLRGNASWVDYDLLKALADHPEIQIILIGIEHDASLQESGILEYKSQISRKETI